MNRCLFSLSALKDRARLSLSVFWLFPNPSQAADWLTINPLNIDLLAGYYARQLETPVEELSRYRWEAGVRIEQEIGILHPGILKVRYYLEPRYRRGEYENERTSVDDSSNFLGYFFGLDILKGATLPVDGRLFAKRSSNINSGSLGSRSENELTEFFAEMRWKYAPLPMVFSANERSTLSRSRSTIGSLDLLRDDTERIFLAKGSSSKMDLELEHRTLDDHVPGRNNDFSIYQFRGRHRLNWGSGSRLSSRLNYFDRSGRSAYQRFNWTQDAVVHHPARFQSKLLYNFVLTGQTFDTKQSSAEYKLNHSLYGNLTSGAGPLYTRRESPNLLETTKQFNLNVGYRKNRLWGANVGLYLGGTYGRVNRDSDKGFLEVQDESYTVPVSGQIILQTRFIITSSILVTSSDSTFVYQEGVDYEIFGLADGLTQLTTLPAGRIQLGETLLISYKALILPSVEYDRITRTTVLNLGFRGFLFNYRNDALRNDVISGAAASLLDTRNESINLSYSLEVARFALNLRAEQRLNIVGDNEFKSRTASQALSLPITERASIQLSLTQSFTETFSQRLIGSVDEDIEYYAAALSATWRPMSSMVVKPRFQAYTRTLNRESNIIGIDGEPVLSTDFKDDTVFSAGLSINWRFRRLSMSLSYYHNDRTSESDNALGPQENVEDAVWFYLRRRL